MKNVYYFIAKLEVFCRPSIVLNFYLFLQSATALPHFDETCMSSKFGFL